jgi:hypothetical protein
MQRPLAFASRPQVENEQALIRSGVASPRSVANGQDDDHGQNERAQDEPRQERSKHPFPLL